MTKPDEFYKNVVNTMNYLDTVLPKGSHIIMTGLANGSLLFDSLGDRVYPLGRVKNDIKYSDIYTYLSCLQISPWFVFFLIIKQLCLITNIHVFIIK